MHHVNPLARKRVHSIANNSLPDEHSHKVNCRRDLRFDGPGSTKSAGSSSTGREKKPGIKSRVKRGFSSIRSFLGIGDGAGSPPDRPRGDIPGSGLAVVHGWQIESIHQNGSNVTVIRPVKLPLNQLDGDYTNYEIQRQPYAVQSALSSPNSLVNLEPGVNYFLEPPVNQNPYHQDLRRSHSTQGLSRHLPQNIQSPVGNATIVRRSDLRSRPSIQISHEEPQKIVERLPSSSPSTYNSDDGSTPPTCPQSTAPTSDGITISPSSIFQNVGVSLSDRNVETMLQLAASRSAYSKMMQKHSEGLILPNSSITTAEAAANTKIFLEMHFNSLLNMTQPRARRRQDLDLKLKMLQLPPHIQERIRKQWEINESNNLRQERLLKTMKKGGKASKGISIGDFEIVRVLGKGSFGVVRLVKMKVKASSWPVISNSGELVTKHNAQTILRISGREILAPMTGRYKDLTKMKKEVYAMKVIRKSEMVRNSQEGHIRAERDFLVAAEGSRWIIPLLTAFQDSRFLYLIMDFCIGGDFLGLLIRKSILSEEITKRYVAEMILCVEEAHKLRWIHRDVKPDNFLIGADGHLKISDFGLAFDGEWAHDQSFYHKHRHSLVQRLGIHVEGDEVDKREQEEAETSRNLAKIVSSPVKRVGKESSTSNDSGLDDKVLDRRNQAQRRRLARSVVGTSQYMAPEVVQGEPYDGRCDWWSIGIIMYECLFGYTPFACEDRHQTKLKILHHKKNLTFPSCSPDLDPSPDALDLIIRLLVEKERRLSTKRYELNDFTKKFIGGRCVKFASDRMHTNYAGNFVYPDDAEDIKRHPFFHNIPWDSMHVTRPPFVPRVKSWEDTKYFDEEYQISDVESGSSVDEDITKRSLHQTPFDDGTHIGFLIPWKPTFHMRQYQRKDQQITSLVSAKPDEKLLTKQSIPNPAEEAAVSLLGQPNIISRATPLQMDGISSPVPTLVDSKLHWKDQKLPNLYQDSIARVSDRKSTKKDKKRPRDKILRDTNFGKKAVAIRRNGAFLGYSYSKPKSIEEIIGEVLTKQRSEPEREYSQDCLSNSRLDHEP